jgi:hypothetical protein
MPNTHYYAIVGDSHVRGRRQPAPLTIDRVYGQRLVVVAPPSPPVQLNTIVRGSVSGSMARVVRIVSATEWIVESLPGATGFPGFAFAQNYNLAGFPLTGEALNLDTGGTAVLSFFGNAQDIPGDNQFAPLHNDRWLNDIVPPDGSDFVWWDGNAKPCQTIDLTALTGSWNTGDRVQTSAGGQFTILFKSAPTTWAVVRKTGAAIAPSQTITNLTSPGGTGTVASVAADPVRGQWVPFTQMPNGSGVTPANTIVPDTSWEFARNGNGTDGGEAGIGPENRLVHRAFERWQQQPDVDDRAIRVLTFSSNDGQTFPDGVLGGVSVQVVRCSGTFPGTWIPGEVVTGPGGWSGTVIGHSVVQKMVYVHSTNGATLGSGTITGALSASTATATGPALGWQPGSAYWNAFVAKKNEAMASPVALWTNGSGVPSPARWEGVALMCWETEIAVHSSTYGCPVLPTELAQKQWVNLITKLREHLGREDLPVAVWKHRLESQRGVQFFGIPISFFVHLAIDKLPDLLPNVVVTDSAAYEMAAPPVATADPNLWLQTDAYVSLGDDFWRAFGFGNTVVEPADWVRVPIVFYLGQSQATGFMSAQLAMTLDLDPVLWPSTTFPVGVGVDTTDPKCLSWNTRTLQLQPMHAGVNCNGFWGTDPATCGSEVPIMARFKMRVSNDEWESDRCILAKFTVPGSAINANVPNATAVWDPDLTTRPELTVSCTITALAGTSSLPARGRISAAVGTFTADIWTTNLSITVAGSALGVLGVGGNNTRPYAVQVIRDRAADGSWIEVVGPFVTEPSVTLTLTAGPPPIFPELRRQVDALWAACAANRMIPDPRVVIWEQGESDLGFQENRLVDEYEAALRRFWAALEPLLGMRGKSENPIAKCLVMTTERTPWAVPDDDVRQLREIQARVGNELANCVVVDPSKLALEYGGYPNPRTRLQNGVHFTGRSMITKGFMIDAALGTLGPSKGIPEHPKGELDGSFFGAVNGGSDGLAAPTALTFIGGAAALALGAPVTGGLVVEDGSGVDNAESLCTVEEFQEFWDANNASAAITNASEVRIAAALRRATREWILGVCGNRWRGRIQYLNQRLPFPRYGCYDDDNRLVPTGSIPWQLVHATCLVAGHLIEGGSVLANGVAQGAITRETKKGVGFEKTIEYAEPASGGGSGVTRLRAAEALVATFMAGNSGGNAVGRS